MKKEEEEEGGEEKEGKGGGERIKLYVKNLSLPHTKVKGGQNKAGAS